MFKAKRFFLLMFVIATVLGGCSQQGSGRENLRIQLDENAEKPDLPESLKIDENGIPVLKVYDISSERIEEMNLEEYVMGVVAGEMKNNWPIEALKAQAIAARTYALYQNDNNKILKTDTSDQCYINENEMKNKWGEKYKIYKNKIEQLVNETTGIVMNKNNKLFKSFYFSTYH